LRKLAVTIAAVLLAALAAAAPVATSAALAATGPKVAIIVGATHGTTPQYRAYADEIYAEAIRYTPNVVRVYSPGATWSRVKAAVNGASIVVYLGHGNGWPSPYTYDPAYTTKDGFGLNYDLNGDGKLTDYENKYYGEPSIRTLTPAPNAVVLLFHLCYASGNSEPGGAAPSLSIAKQRADNYASAFLRTGARAVVAIGHSHSDYYIRELFSSRQTIEDYWRNAPDANDHVLTAASARTPGSTVLLDPDSAAPSGFYRSLTGQLTLRTEDVTGASYAATDTDPADFAVPGNASPTGDGTPLYGSAESATAGVDPVTSLAAADRVRIDGQEPVPSAVDGSRVFRIHTDAGAEGWMPASTLTPRDVLAPRAWEVDAGTGAFSPNADGSRDTFPVSVRLSERAAWTLRVGDGSGHELASRSGNGDTAALTWAPAPGSVPDGSYRWTIDAVDAWGNGQLAADGTIALDTQAPVLSMAAADATAIPVFTPNGDGFGDTIGLAVGSSEPGSVVGTVRRADGAGVDTLGATVGSGAASLTWDGRTAQGPYAPDGTYGVEVVALDRAGNASAPQTATLRAYGAMGFVRASRTLFFPQDGDRVASSTSLSFVLARPATVTWTIVNAAGSVVRTIATDLPMDAGTHAFAWNGRNDLGAFVARGTYRSIVRATDGADLGAVQAVAVLADAFRIAPSDTTPGRGQRITVTATTAEALAAAPRLRVNQPGRSGWSVAMTRVSSGVYRATITFRSGPTGTTRLTVYGKDAAGHLQTSVMTVRLH
jgi:flagellar hook assembly protein FlgD